MIPAQNDGCEFSTRAAFGHVITDQIPRVMVVSEVDITRVLSPVESNGFEEGRDVRGVRGCVVAPWIQWLDLAVQNL